MTRGEIETTSGMERTKVIRILNRLIENRTVERIGTGREPNILLLGNRFQSERICYIRTSRWSNRATLRRCAYCQAS